MIGNPQIILLDEPSAGMDPESRRFMWSVVGRIARKKTSAVVLTTHSMEEAEALSTKMGIMVKGGIFKCFGSAQHIRNKFGTGYVIEIKIRAPEQSDLDRVIEESLVDGKLKMNSELFDISVQESMQQVIGNLSPEAMSKQVFSDVQLMLCMRELSKVFGQVELLEQYGNYMRVRVARLDKSIGYVFGLVQQMRNTHHVSEYSVSQTTLEQIFQSFADIQFTENVVKFNLDQGRLTQIK